MSITLVLLIPVLILLFIWIGSLWLVRGEDLAAYDHPLDPAGAETIASQGGISVEHGHAVTEIAAMGAQVGGMSRKQMLQLTRDFMEEVPSGKTFSCEFVPTQVNGRPAEWVLAPGIDPARRVLYIHGGAFIAGSPNSHRTITSRFSEIANAAVLAIDYRLMPEHARREGIEDCKKAYRWVLENGPTGPAEPARLFMGGDSAGGNLSLVLAAWIRDEGLRLPDAVIAMSPLTDSTYSGASIRNNLETDVMLGPLFGGLVKIPRAVLSWIYFIENKVRPSHPEVSPVFGDLGGLPPTLLQVSEAEMLLDDSRRYVNKARGAGSPVFLQSWGGLLHVWQIFYPEVPEARAAWEHIGAFLQKAEQGIS
ncbi:MAG: alpha/beta hydrolase [Xanthomonadales bacterium]|nr:alpha/beta hydrolase [Gammaproteobacteria bacterium]MBT8053994.1 alpha/beta hydrolase [Gammaproteobacteria bacterium]NND56726.1 alpha/beta hydrolase [Xanthomonadales bacterium]NNK51954.1 alpha/beta hydrolase [Xanthomonadales bacterium]